MKKLLYVGGGSLLLLIALLCGSLFAGPLLASAHSTNGTATQPTTTTHKTAKTPKTKAEREKLRKEEHPLREFTRNHKDELVAQIAPQLHLTKDQLTAKLKSGERIEQIAKDEKISTASLKTIIINSTDTVINNALHNKKIDQKRATELTNLVKEHPFVVSRVLHRQFDGKIHHKHVAATKTAKSTKSAKSTATPTSNS